MTVFAWIVFIISALSTLVYAWEWFTQGNGIVTLLQSVGGVVCCVLYLFFSLIPPISYIFFGVYCAFMLLALCRRKIYGTLHGIAYVVFLALLIF